MENRLPDRRTMEDLNGNPKFCEVCQKPINIYGHSYVRIELVQNVLSFEEDTYNGLPDENVKKRFECCPLCTLTALKNVLIGQRQDDLFEKYLET